MPYIATRDFFRLGNEQSCKILGVGDVQLIIQNGFSFMLTKSLISIGILHVVGYMIVLGINTWKISKESMTIGYGLNLRNFYMLHVSSVKHNGINVTK